MKEIVIINGTGGCGKDTFVNYVSKYARVFNFSSVDKVKEIAKLIGWNGAKEEKDRKFLSDLKKITTDYNDMSFNSIKEAVAKFIESDDEIMFIHIREPEEIERAVMTFNANTLLIKKTGLDAITSNTSDAFVENYDYDFMIENTTLKNLDNQAKKFVYILKKNESCNNKIKKLINI